MEDLTKKSFSRSPKAVERRKRAMKRLENQLLTGFKTVTHKDTGAIGTEPLTDGNKLRIKHEIAILKARI